MSENLSLNFELATGNWKIPIYTRLRFGGLHPLCGIGVTSRIDRTSRPAVCSARIADSRPEPGPLTSTSHDRMPNALAALVALSAACVAANGVPLREPLKPIAPALDPEIGRASCRDRV